MAVFSDDVIGDLNVTPPSAPSGGSGGGAATNMFAQSGVQSWDQWLHAPVVLGQRKMKPGGKGASLVTPSEARGASSPMMATPFSLLQTFDAMSAAEYQKFKNKLVAAGFVSKDSFPSDVRDVWASVLRDVQSAQAAGAKITPFQFLNSLIKKNGLDPKDIPGKAGWDPTEAAAAAQGDGFTPSTSTVKSVYDLDPADAEDLLKNTLAQKLGRDPSREEVEDFVDAVKARALQDPTTVTTRTRRGDLSGQAGPGTQVEVLRQGGKTYSTVTSVNEGFDEQDMARVAERRAENAPDYASYQAVSTYFPALLNALGATV